ncbi:MAG TPA: hypothetical protein VE308_04095 [Nitrososphaera sp.]|nr:hypothetical protein [Nitrososphaera sp.]
MAKITKSHSKKNLTLEATAAIAGVLLLAAVGTVSISSAQLQGQEQEQQQQQQQQANSSAQNGTMTTTVVAVGGGGPSPVVMAFTLQSVTINAAKQSSGQIQLSYPSLIRLALSDNKLTFPSWNRPI